MHVRARLLLLAAVILAACTSKPGAVPPGQAPLTIEAGGGSGISRLTLSESAAKRLGIQTATVAEQRIDGATKTVIPYAAVIYDTDGQTWTYTNPSGFLFVRAVIKVERIDGERAVLTLGPPLSTSVVTVGGAELWGAEHGVGGGH